MNIDSEVSRLHFENFLWFVFIVLSCLNIIGDLNDEIFLKENNLYYKKQSNLIFTFTIYLFIFIILLEIIRLMSYLRMIKNKCIL